MKLKGKLLVMFLAILLVFSTFVSFLMTNGMRRSFEKQVEGSISELNRLGLLLFDAKYPGPWKVQGDSLYKGNTPIDESFDLIDSLISNKAYTATIFCGNIRVATTALDENGNRAVGTEASPEVSQAVLERGESYIGEAMVSGTPAITYYTPLYDDTGKIIGMWYVGYDKKTMLDAVYDNLVNNWIHQCVGLLISSVVIFLLASRMVSPLKSVTAQLIKISEGRFDEEIPDTKLKDEIGDIVKASKTLQQSTRHMVRTILRESEKIDQALAVTVNDMGDLKGDMENASATTEQLSAGIEETAASLQEMNATSTQIEAAVDNMAKRASEGSKTAEEIKARAADLRKKAVESKESALELLNQSQKELEDAIQHSKSISQIQSLTDAILEIATQTNLLSLNAAIEASRAGEHGAGFAVVADEIRKLAEDSKNTVSEIQQVIETVIHAVDNLAKCSQNILGFIGSRVVQDYDVQVRIGEQYDLDAEHMNSMMLDISSTSEQLMASVSNLIKAINDVSVSANEGASGTSDLAGLVTHVNDKCNDVLAMAEKANKSVAALKEYVQKLAV